MRKKTGSVIRVQLKRGDSFTLIELLVVMVIIAILAGLILAAGNGVFEKARRSRSSAEIQAMSTGLEGYKTDNGIYPVYSSSGMQTGYPVDSSPTGGEYQKSSQALYSALSGQVNFLDQPVAGTKVYVNFKANQLGNAGTPSGTASSSTTATYVQDPWSSSYGYNTGYVSGATTNYPYNGSGFFDLWSTAGITQAKYTANNSRTNAWISNWTQ